MTRRIGSSSALVALTLGGTLLACGGGMLVCAAVGVWEGRAAAALRLPGLETLGLGAALVWLSATARRPGFTMPRSPACSR